MTTKIKILIACLVFLQLACTNTTETSSTATSTEKPVVANQGVSIAYNDTYTGDTTLIFVHGWGINQKYWDNQVDFFRKDYRVISMDLPGFGESGKSRDKWTVENYAQDISALINTLNLKKVILIGHSMSGVIVLEAALNNPETVLGIIGIDNFNGYGWVETPEAKKETEDFFKTARMNYKKTVSPFINQTLFALSTDSLVRKRVSDDILSADSSIALTVLEQNTHYPVDAKLKTWPKTLYLVNSSTNTTDTLSFKKNGIKVRLFDVGKTGHYPMLENPDKFNSLLAQAIESIKRQ